MHKREGVVYPKFREQFAVVDFEADPMPVLSLYPMPPSRSLGEVQIQTCGTTGNQQIIDGRQLERLPRTKLETSMICQIFNWTEAVRWEGVRLTELLALAGLECPDDGWLGFYSADQFYFEVLPAALARDPRVLLAYSLNEKPLPVAHGGPLRLVVPFLQGYKSVKWVSQIRAFRQDPVGIKRLLGQSKTAYLGQLWQERSGMISVLPSNAEGSEI